MRHEVKRALVTGASSGIGLALAKRLAARGIEVWLAARRKDLLEREVAAIVAAGGKAHALQLDISDVDATVERLSALDREAGGIDLVVSNAGLAGARGGLPLDKCAWADVRDVLHVNLTGNAATLFPFVQPMLKRGYGQLVGVSSLAADCPIARGAAYGGSKAGLSFFLEGADLELRPRGIACTIIHPGFVETASTDSLKGQAPMPFMLKVDHAARIIERGILLRRRMVRFPWLLGAVARLSAWLPRWLMAPLIRKTSA